MEEKELNDRRTPVQAGLKTAAWMWKMGHYAEAAQVLSTIGQAPYLATLARQPLLWAETVESSDGGTTFILPGMDENGDEGGGLIIHKHEIPALLDMLNSAKEG